MKNKLRSRAEQYELWADQACLRAKSFYNTNSIAVVRNKFDESGRLMAILECFTDWAKLTGNDQFTSGLTPNQMNSYLKVPVPMGGRFDEEVFAAVEPYADLIRNEVIPNTEDRAGRIQPAFRQTNLINRGDTALLISNCFGMLDAVATAVSIDLVYSGEMIVMDRGLAEQVLQAHNRPIKGEDLKNVPFDRTIIEFSEPVPFLRLKDKSVSAIAAGFYRNLVSKCYLVTWYTGRNKFSDYEDAMSSMGLSEMATVLYTPYGTERTIVDEGIRRDLGVLSEDYGIEVIGSVVTQGGPEDFNRYNQDYGQVQKQLLEKSRNLWDFVTCRNIDYEPYRRPTPLHLRKIKKYRHIPNIDLERRQYRVVRVNRVEEPVYGGQALPPEGQMAERVHVPGSFHKWVFCEACKRCHRHDLIGGPCRRCRLQVGPFSNIVVKKYWHSDYWVGPDDAPIKECVREFRK